MALAPLAPEAPEFAGLLVSLLIIAAALVCLGLVTVLHAVTNAVTGTIGHLLGKVPLVGGVLSSPVNAVYHWMNHIFGEAELALDGALAFWLHQLGTLVSWMASEWRANAHLLWMLTNLLLGTTAVDQLVRLTAVLSHKVGAVERAAEAAVARIGHIEATLPARVEAVVLPRIRAIDHAIDWTLPHDIAAIRARARETLDRLENLWKRVSKLDALLGTAAVTAAVAVALTRLELGWVRCNNVGRVGRALCGLPAALFDDLLALAFDALAVADLCDLAYAAGAIAQTVEPVLLEFVDVEEALIGCHGNTAPPRLALPPLTLPANPAVLTLAA